LYYRGILPDFSSECFISVVGTRRLTDYGRRNAYAIGYDLASAGAVTVSGMAIGIDGVAHAGALAAGGKNVAFLGCGIDRCYPADHLTLAREIVKSGCIMTEYAPGTPPERFNFPKRNRLIAALSCATVVVEGKISSGAVITARLARKYGKEIYALPGNVDNATSEVANVLIQNGAKLIISAVDVVKDMENVYLGKVFVGKIKPKPQTAMDEALSRYEISCVCPSDNIFTPARKKRTRKEDIPTLAEGVPAVAADNIEARVPELDAETLGIYQKIPCEGDISVEALVDETDKLNKVMKALLKLEMGKFITMMPGERVKRIL
jgi:DNA protecting protein DprA